MARRLPSYIIPCVQVGWLWDAEKAESVRWQHIAQLKARVLPEKVVS
jgi:hypothetical protein